MCCYSWGHKESDTTERLNRTEPKQPWRRTDPLKTVDFHIYAYFYLRFPWVSAAAAKSLQSCLTLCDPIDGSLPGSAVHGILQQLTNLTAAPSRLIKGDLFL